MGVDDLDCVESEGSHVGMGVRVGVEQLRCWGKIPIPVAGVGHMDISTRHRCRPTVKYASVLHNPTHLTDAGRQGQTTFLTLG